MTKCTGAVSCPCDFCQFERQTAAFDASVLADLQRIERDRLTLALHSKSTRSLDRGKRPFDESPLFSTAGQDSLF